mmetsp:Transcript_13529/g.47747  ORF Transcript_13529/g.47747 Transcript_13529/m.47747 type:complete len:345 (+) Transcript_13529:2109-3143(+)
MEESDLPRQLLPLQGSQGLKPRSRGAQHMHDGVQVGICGVLHKRRAAAARHGRHWQQVVDIQFLVVERRAPLGAHAVQEGDLCALRAAKAGPGPRLGEGIAQRLPRHPSLAHPRMWVAHHQALMQGDSLLDVAPPGLEPLAAPGRNTALFVPALPRKVLGPESLLLAGVLLDDHSVHHPSAFENPPALLLGVPQLHHQKVAELLEVTHTIKGSAEARMLRVLGVFRVLAEASLALAQEDAGRAHLQPAPHNGGLQASGGPPRERSQAPHAPVGKDTAVAHTREVGDVKHRRRVPRLKHRQGAAPCNGLALEVMFGLLVRRLPDVQQHRVFFRLDCLQIHLDLPK